MKLLMIYLIIVNAAGLLLMLIDKQRAQKNQWRIRESTLIGIAVVGGSVGVFLGMRIFRHKTKHAKFYIGVPVILILHALLTVLLFAFRIDLL